jgi:N-acetylglucosamine-6-phosphate deacetylase
MATNELPTAGGPLCVSHATLLTPDQMIRDAAVLISDGQIETVGPASQVAVPASAEVLDGSGQLLVPGFIDLQLNGAFGLDITENPETIWQVAEGLPRYGVTAFLPTVITSPLSTVEQAQDVLLGGSPDGFAGSWPLGLHVEGPYLNPSKRGAHNPTYLRQPQLDEVIHWSPATGVRLVTLAPELPGALWLVEMLAGRGIVVSAGHSLATYEQARAGFDAGIRYATHLFNAMPAVHHRQPGLVGAALADERVVIGLISDGNHVHPSLVKLIWRLTSEGRLSLVTDAMAALGAQAELGAEPGTFRLGDHRVTVTDGLAQLDDGTLAGSVLSLDQAMRNLVDFAGCSLPDALLPLTATPAGLLGLGGRKGSIRPGYDADLVLLSPDLSVLATIVAGRVVYRQES